ncbi:MAG: hypothetical protein AAB152_12830 [Candidatus Coatesbacteria bacterium]
MRRSLIALVIMAMPVVAAASAAGRLQEARDGKRSAFVVVYDGNSAGLEDARAMAKAGREKAGKARVSLVELNRDEAANRDLVEKYGLAGAPVPLLLVVAPNGAVAGGFPAARGNADVLVRMLPTPKKADVLGALAAGRAVVLCIYGKDAPGMEAVRAACAKARDQMKGKLTAVFVAKDDPEEARFLAELRVGPEPAGQMTLVINTAGQVTSGFPGPVDAGLLVAAANKKGGGMACAPGACGPGAKSCAPGAAKSCAPPAAGSTAAR